MRLDLILLKRVFGLKKVDASKFHKTSISSSLTGRFYLFAFRFDEIACDSSSLFSGSSFSL